jgi:hypothetical protein
LCSGFTPRKPITTKTVEATDFTIVVRMGDQHGADRFYIVPTSVAYTEIGKRQSELAERGGNDIGMWRLSFASRKKGEVAGSGIEKKWAEYLDRWDLLDG